MSTQNRKQMLAQLKAIYPEAKLGKVKTEDLEWLTEVVSHITNLDGKRSMAETLARYRAKYQPVTSAAGRKSLNNGDDIALFLEGMTHTEVLQAAERILGFESGELQERYAHLNIGAQRMNGGNRLRAALKRGDITTNDLH